MPTAEFLSTRFYKTPVEYAGVAPHGQSTLGSRDLRVTLSSQPQAQGLWALMILSILLSVVCGSWCRETVFRTSRCSTSASPLSQAGMCRQTCPFPLLLLCCLGQAFCGRANTTHLLVLEVASVPQSPPDASFYSLCSGLSLFLLNKKVLKNTFLKSVFF